MEKKTVELSHLFQFTKIKTMKFISGLKNFKNKLIRIGTREPLNIFSILIILGLDLFVLTNLFQGLDLQARQLEAPWEKIPYQCTGLISSLESDENKKQTVLRALDQNLDYYSEIENKFNAALVNNKNKQKIDLKCQEVFDAALLLNNNADLQWLNDDIEELNKEKQKHESAIYQYEKDYDTMLLEDIANQPNQASIIEGKSNDVKDKIRELKNAISTIELRIENIEAKIMESEDVTEFLSILVQNEESILETEKSLKFWYPLKKTGVQFLFLFPLLLLFIYLYRRSLNKGNELLVLIFAHLLVVVSIPILFEIIRLFLEILPFNILADVLEILEALNLIVLWNYLLIFLGVLITIALIYFIQKKLFSKERLYLKRIAKGKCFACGVKIREDLQHCYNCGTKQFLNCPNCKKSTYLKGTNCTNCGFNLKQNKENK